MSKDIDTIIGYRLFSNDQTLTCIWGLLETPELYTQVLRFIAQAQGDTRFLEEKLKILIEELRCSPPLYQKYGGFIEEITPISKINFYEIAEAFIVDWQYNNNVGQTGVNENKLNN